MASNDTLYMTLELRDNLKKQLEEGQKSMEKLIDASKATNDELA